MIPHRVETPRLILRCWSPEDAKRVKKAEDESRDHLRAFLTWADRGPETLAETTGKLLLQRARFDRSEDFVFGVFDKNTGDVVGGTGLHPRVGKGGLEIGYWVHAARLRRGVATEIAGALTRVAFEIAGVRWVEIRCAKTNEASAGVPAKLGFTHEATLRERLEVKGGLLDDALVFTMLGRDYATSAAKRIPIEAFDPAGEPVKIPR